ncbi:hypothetical protein AB3K25_02710 [Leuconostoc sp. MS02]|uniref:Uncharacterized protein n=1 Tax=Leuconostoc aquikimchii TaxID=3236804 RepID=A0ABV3S3Z8_9LACO
MFVTVLPATALATVLPATAVLVLSALVAFDVRVDVESANDEESLSDIEVEVLLLVDSDVLSDSE